MSYWRIRGKFEAFDPFEAYKDEPNMISLKITHGGFFSKSPGRKYLKGKTNYVDLVDSEMFSVIDLNEMVEQIGYTSKHPMFYHFKIPDENLDNGLQDLGTDHGIINLLKYTCKSKVIEVFIEHFITNVIPPYDSPGKSNVVIEELPTQGAPEPSSRRKPFRKSERPSCKKQLLLEYTQTETKDGNEMDGTGGVETVTKDGNGTGGVGNVQTEREDGNGTGGIQMIRDTYLL